MSYISGKLRKTGYELSDINIVQAPVSYIEHRSECDTMIEMCGRKVHPVIVAPMAAVTDENNYKVWLDNNFICVVPRTVDFEKRLEICKETFCSFSLDESESLYKNTDIFLGLVIYDKIYVCIDIAQGTMDRLYSICRELKEKFGEDKIEIMTGNVATPDAYDYYADAGIDYMRLSIGTGSRCVCSGTQILMADGTTLSIEDVDVGDFVKTIDGNEKVLKTFSKNAKETIVINGDIETTPEHKFLVIKKTDAENCDCEEKIKEKAFYLEAKFITSEFLLVKD